MVPCTQPKRRGGGHRWVDGGGGGDGLEDDPRGHGIRPDSPWALRWGTGEVGGGGEEIGFG